MEDEKESDPDARIFVTDELLQQPMEESYVGSSEESWMLDSKFNPKFQVSKFVIVTNFADFARRFRLIMHEARVNASMQLMFVAQSLPDAMTD